jgi:hypothetical protein
MFARRCFVDGQGVPASASPDLPSLSVPGVKQYVHCDKNAPHRREIILPLALDRHITRGRASLHKIAC